MDPETVLYEFLACLNESLGGSHLSPVVEGKGDAYSVAFVIPDVELQDSIETLSERYIHPAAKAVSDGVVGQPARFIRLPVETTLESPGPRIFVGEMENISGRCAMVYNRLKRGMQVLLEVAFE